MRKTLLIMAAGMGSRYGGLKQIDCVGPGGQYLIDYSVYDALQAGFERVVFVIRQEFAADFQAHFAATGAQAQAELIYLNQEMTDLPEGFSAPPGRTKPWGTGHAVWTARKTIQEPFAVISADDFYGRGAFLQAAEWIDSLPADSRKRYGVVGYQISKTLSANGWVARGLLKTNEAGLVTSIHEHTKIGWCDGKIVSRDKQGVDHEIAPDRPVSMILFAFTPDIFSYLDEGLLAFLTQYGHDESREFFTPNVVNDLIQAGIAQMQMLPTHERWFGVTYAADKQTTVGAIKQLIADGVYPEDLWAEYRRA